MVRCSGRYQRRWRRPVMNQRAHTGSQPTTGIPPASGTVTATPTASTMTATGTYRGELYVGMASRPIRYLAVIGSLLLFRRDLRPSRWWLALYLWGWVAYFRYFLQT